MSTTKFAYWDIRGLGEPIRYLLHYKGIKFEDKRYLSWDEWKKEKFNLNLDFPNLPYYMDKSVKLTQSTAILRYLARKHDLLGKTNEEQLQVEIAEQQLIDFSNKLFDICYSPDYEKIKGEFAQNVPSQLKLFSAFLGDRKFFAGDSVTYVDCIAYDTFDFYWIVIPGVLNEFPSLKNFVERFEKLPELQEYLQSPTYKRWPIATPPATFGGKGPEPERV